MQLTIHIPYHLFPPRRPAPFAFRIRIPFAIGHSIPVPRAARRTHATSPENECKNALSFARVAEAEPRSLYAVLTPPSARPHVASLSRTCHSTTSCAFTPSATSSYTNPKAEVWRQPISWTLSF